MPHRSGEWGAELSDDDYACAVAEAGVRREVGDGHVIWDWNEPADPASDYLHRWKQRLSKARSMRVWMGTYSVDAWRHLSRPAAGIDALMNIYPIVDEHATPERWAWPWQIVDLTRGARLRPLLDATARKRTIESVAFDERTTAGLVIVDGPLTVANAMLATEHKRVRANAVLVVGSIEPAARAHPWLAWSLAEQLAAPIVMVGAPDDDDAIVRLIEEISIELSHDHPIDRALISAARTVGVEPPVLHAEPSVIERARMSKRAVHLVQVLKDLGFTDSGTTFSGLESMRGSLDTLVERLDFGAESRGATTVGAMEREQRDRDAHSADKMLPRYLQGWLTRDGESEHATVIHPDALYTVGVKIGEFDPTLLQVVNPIREPYAGVTVSVDVIVSERNLLPVPLRTTMDLPPNGSSKPVTFALRTRPGVARLELRVTILHRGRVLQSGIIRAAIDGHDRLQFDVDAVGRHHLAGLEHRREFDAAIVANHAADGTPGFLGAVPDGVGYITIEPSHLDALTQQLGATISAIEIDPPRYATLESEGTVEMLRELALRGAAFHRLLAKHTALGKGLLEAERIQIIAARPNTFLPLELVYSLKTPAKNAPLCENARAALHDGRCTDTCGGRDGSRVCPLGFWGLSRVIERHEHRPQLAPLTQGAEFRAHDSRAKFVEATTPERSKIQPPQSVVFAASNRVDRVVKTTSADLAAKLEETFGAANVKKVGDWDDWIPAVSSSKRPNLLVVVPHTKASDHNDQILEIGDASDLRSLEVVEDHVIGTPVPDPAPKPIVFLLGCETSAAKVPNESFVTIFRDREAAVVISTISTILGRDAAPVAAALAKAIVDQHRNGGGFAGEAMTKIRRQMLLEGKAMVLAVTMYGDADWVLAPA
jgi:hypothetical protein